MATKKTTKTTTTKNAAPKGTKKAAPKTAAPKKAAPAKEPEAKPAGDKKLSAIDAAAQVLSKAETPMNAKELIEAMATQKLWTSPGGKTPHATLYSAILREINTKGKDARFTKVERGQFAANG